jgi:hypothetical protein
MTARIFAETARIAPCPQRDLSTPTTKNDGVLDGEERST